MCPGCKKLALDGGVDDILSELPIHVLDRIFEFLPVNDGARTSILSRKWRYFWSAIPCLVFGTQYVGSMFAKVGFSANKLVNLIHKVLLVHRGPLIKFVLVIPNLDFDWDEHLDVWLLFLSRSGIKLLHLEYHRPTRYKLPSYVFSYPKLTNLSLKNIIFKPPVGFSGFANLVTLFFKLIEFSPCTLSGVSPVAPLLNKLIFYSCIGIENFNIFAPRLVRIGVIFSPEVAPIFLDNFPNVIRIYIDFGREQKVAYHGEGSPVNLYQLHKKFPRVEFLGFDGWFLKFSAAIIIQRSLSFVFYHLTCLAICRFAFDDMDQVSCTLWLLSKSPMLRTTKIETSKNTDVAPAFTQFEAPDSVGEMLSLLSLQNVELNGTEGSKAELLFIKFILAHSPNLESVKIKYRDEDRDHWCRIRNELMQFHRASTNAKITFKG